MESTDSSKSLRTHKDKLKFIQVRHEEAAAFAAVGYAKYTGRIGVCCATSGPGGVHLLNGLYDAKCDLQPVLAITGHTFHDLIGMDYQQDVDLDKLLHGCLGIQRASDGTSACRECCGHGGAHRLRSPRGFPHLHSERHSGVGGLGQAPQQRQRRAPQRRLECSFDCETGDPLLQQAADIINAGSKVAIFAGRGALGCREEVTQLAEIVGGPVVKASLGKAVLPDRSPYTTGGIGLLGTAPSVDAMNECDTLIMIGTSYPYMEFLPKPGQAKCVQIDIDPTRIGLRHPVDVGLVGDAKTILTALLPLLQREEE